MKTKLYLIDGTALLYRSHYAFIANPLVNSKGQHTSAIFGVINSFLKLLELKDATHIIISFDRKGPTFRHELSDEYKAQRPPMPDELTTQVEPVKEFFTLIGLPEISLDGYEADDVLGTLAERYKKDYEVVLVTSDKDYSQLVEDGVSIWDPAKDQTLDSAAIFKRFGVWPHQFIDYLALVGDASDNIPGVRGIGPKSAEALLSEFNSLDEIYADLSRVPDKYRKKLEPGREDAFLSRQLATIVRQVPLENIAVNVFDPQALTNAAEFMNKYELITLKRRLEVRAGQRKEKVDTAVHQADIFDTEPTEADTKTPAVPARFKAILATQANLPQLWQGIAKAQQISIDVETDSVNPMQANLVGISLCLMEEEAWYLPVGHQMQDNLPATQILEQLKNALKGKTLIGHNLKYDLTIFQRHGIRLENKIFDTMLAAYVLEPGTNQYSLDACAARELHYEMIPISRLIGSGKNQISFDLVSIEDATGYAAEDAWVAFKLMPIYQKRLAFTNLKKLYDEIELPLIRVLQDMETNGVALDTTILRELSSQINHELKRLTDEVYDYAGYQFNLNSTQQLAKLLFTEKGLPPKKKTKTGFSTDSTVLEELAIEHDIAKVLIQHRMYSKLESTYVSALPKLIDETTGRVHSSFNQTVASTGRLSSSNPNLQNIPIRTQLGRQIRKAFIPSAPDRVILAADYSQIELRLLALFSQDEVLLNAFAHGLDIHRQTAAIIYGKSLDEVTDDDRREAKTINFGLLYGMGAQKLGRELSINQKEAKELIQNYFQRFPTIQNYIQSSVETARQLRYCQTLFGRKLYLPNINSPNPRLRSEEERVAVNMPIQGTAADLIKIAMLKIHKQIKEDEGIRLILQVHDELVFDVLEGRVEDATGIIRSAMESALPREHASLIHLRTDIGVGKNWFEAH
ncbi:MAG: DNA polymerase I [Candidatus Cloacimonetes bacterium]|nr:DNA polymerase I [Candidatus Cloacimonadota bacterium]